MNVNPDVKSFTGIDDARLFLDGRPLGEAVTRILEIGALKILDDEFWNIVQSLGYRDDEDNAEALIKELIDEKRNGPLGEDIDSAVNAAYCDRTHVAYLLGIAVGRRLAIAGGVK